MGELYEFCCPKHALERVEKSQRLTMRPIVRVEKSEKEERVGEDPVHLLGRP
jgi:hypothetical protein